MNRSIIRGRKVESVEIPADAAALIFTEAGVLADGVGNVSLRPSSSVVQMRCRATLMSLINFEHGGSNSSGYPIDLTSLE